MTKYDLILSLKISVAIIPSSEYFAMNFSRSLGKKG
jgi:hypothetical protein